MIKALKPVLRRPLQVLKNGTPYSLNAASGLVRTETHFYVIADNELDLGVFDLSKDIGDLVPLIPGTLPADEKARKKQKPDFETLFLLEDHRLGGKGLVAFSSGSSEKRMTAVYIPIGTDSTIKSLFLRPFGLQNLFTALIDAFGGINIEGAAVDGEHWLLFHRGYSNGDVNRKIKLPREALVQMILGQSVLFDPKKFTSEILRIGHLQSVPLTITDVTLFEQRCFFIAAAEDTTNPIDDGEIMGTVFGELRTDGEVQIFGLLPGQKAEGLSLRRRMARPGAAIELSMVTDNDNPELASELLDFLLTKI